MRQVQFMKYSKSSLCMRTVHSIRESIKNTHIHTRKSFKKQLQKLKRRISQWRNQSSKSWKNNIQRIKNQSWNSGKAPPSTPTSFSPSISFTNISFSVLMSSLPDPFLQIHAVSIHACGNPISIDWRKLWFLEREEDSWYQIWNILCGLLALFRLTRLWASKLWSLDKSVFFLLFSGAVRNFILCILEISYYEGKLVGLEACLVDGRDDVKRVSSLLCDYYWGFFLFLIFIFLCLVLCNTTVWFQQSVVCYP